MDALRKCDAATREALANGAQERVAVLVRVDGAAEGLRHALEQSGLAVHTTTGPIVSGEIDLRDLRALAELPCVRRVELSQALHFER